MHSAQQPRTGATPPAPGIQPSRRTLLGRTLLGTAAHIGGLTGGLAGTLAAAGCGHRPPPVPHPDVGVLVGVIGSEERLVALYERARQLHAGLAETVDPALAHHREHLAALRRHYRPGSTPGVTRGATPPASRRAATPPSLPDEPRQAIAALRAAERAAAASRGAEVGRVSPGLAQLLASIGACEASHDALLARRA